MYWLAPKAPELPQNKITPQEEYPLSSDWSINNFVMLVFEKKLFSHVWTENSDWTLE